MCVTLKYLICIMFTMLFPKKPIVTLTFDLWSRKSIGFTLLPSIMGNKGTKLDQMYMYIQNFSLYHIHSGISIFSHDLHFWSLTLKIYRIDPLAVSNICTKFDSKTLKQNVPCSQGYFHINQVNMTFDLCIWSWKSIGFILSSSSIHACLPDLMKIMMV